VSVAELVDVPQSEVRGERDS